MKILVFGEVLWDVYPDKKCIGGAAFNFSAHSSLLGNDVSLLSAVGNDELGLDTFETVKKFGIDTAYLLNNDKSTGSVTVTLNDQKIPSYNVHTDTAYDNVILDDTTLNKVKNEAFDCLYFGTLSQRSPVSRSSLIKLLEHCTFNNIFCDVNIRKDCYDLDSVKRCFENATVIKISDEEEPILRDLGIYACDGDDCKDISNAISAKFKNLKIIIITLGSKGSFAYDAQNGKCYYADIVPCIPVSTVGAGDSFGAAFINEYLKSNDVKASLNEGAVLSSYVVSQSEAVPIK